MMSLRKDDFENLVADHYPDYLSDKVSVGLFALVVDAAEAYVEALVTERGNRDVEASMNSALAGLRENLMDRLNIPF